MWETLGLQALERCEMTMAYGLLHLVGGGATSSIYNDHFQHVCDGVCCVQASRKAPSKAALLHSCAELNLAFDKRPEALAFAKKSYKMQVPSRCALDYGVTCPLRSPFNISVSLSAICLSVFCVWLQSANADLRNLLLLLDPESMRDGLRTAAKSNKGQTVNKQSRQ